MRPLRILTVCGSGTVSSSMIAEKLREILKQKGYEIQTTEIKPTEVKGYVEQGNYDFVATTSPLPETYSIPVINAVGFLTGFDEEGFIEEVMKVIEEIRRRENW